MKIMTTRFGEIDFEEKDIITFPNKGINGFSQLIRYAILKREETIPFKWLQSIEDPNVAFLIMDPLTFFPDYDPKIDEKDLEELEHTKSSDLITYVIVTVPPDISQASANLTAPLIINDKNKLAKQAVIVDSRYTVRHNILDELRNKKRRERKEKRKSVRS